MDGECACFYTYQYFQATTRGLNNALHQLGSQTLPSGHWCLTNPKYYIQHSVQCLKLLKVATSPFQVRVWLTGYKEKFLGSSAVRGTYVCIDTTSPNEDTTSPGAKTTSFLDTTSL